MKESYRKRTSDPTWPRAMRGQAARLHLKRWTGVYVGGVLATARWQGRIKQLEKPSSSQREIAGAGPTYNRRYREKEGRREGDGRASSSEEAAVMAVEQRGPAVGNDSNKKEGKGEMTKTPISLQDLRKSLYVKAKAEP